jgi:hypothetical protein
VTVGRYLAFGCIEGVKTEDTGIDSTPSYTRPSPPIPHSELFIVLPRSLVKKCPDGSIGTSHNPVWMIVGTHVRVLAQAGPC